jgi:hypothetical protein
MKEPRKYRPDDGWGAPQSHRNISQLLLDVAAITDEQQQVAALRSCPRSVRALLYFAMGPFELDLPLGPLSYAVISTNAYVDDPRAPPDEDLLASEAFRLTRIFARGVHQTITSERRLELWKSIMERLPRDERELMDHARMYREVSGISREAVDAAFPGMLDTAPKPERPVPGIEYAPSAMDNPTPIAERAAPAAQREQSASEVLYQEMILEWAGEGCNAAPFRHRAENRRLKLSTIKGALHQPRQPMSGFRVRVQSFSATPLVVYRLAFRSPRSFADVD